LSEIRDDLQQARDSLERAWEWHQMEIARNSPDYSDQGGWLSAVERFKVQAVKIDDQIRSYNLEVPSPSFQIPLMEIDQEIKRVVNNGDS